MAIVYNKAGESHKCSDEDAEILIESKHFTKNKPSAKKADK